MDKLIQLQITQRNNLNILLGIEKTIQEQIANELERLKDTAILIRLAESGAVKVVKKKRKRRPDICPECNRNTKAPLFDGCMNGPKLCPYGFSPCI